MNGLELAPLCYLDAELKKQQALIGRAKGQPECTEERPYSAEALALRKHVNRRLREGRKAIEEIS